MANILVFESSILIKISIPYGVLRQIKLQNDKRRGESSKAVNNSSDSVDDRRYLNQLER